ncbi:MAG TPA: serine/threonine-protein kinase [bacterium]|nr:serine/threonine-protein kinase [bacterium]
MSPETASAEDSPSGSFGQYQLLEKIAQGGMAEIFRGRALDAQGLERPVVIKRILPHIAASPEFVEMLVDEAKIAVMLSHGNIAQIYDLGKVADDYFIVMEYVEGKTLSQIMKRLKTQGKLMPVAYAAYVCREIASALDYMHRKTDDEGNLLHIVHRDISPQNAILSTAGTIKIIDFGIAKAKTKVSTTDSGVLKGKFAYMSPEHAEGLKLDHRTDIFSLGVILFELLTGTRLFKGKTNMETVKRVKKAKVPAPSGIRSAIPKSLDRIVLKALQKDRNKRYQSAHDLLQDLTKFLVVHFPDFSPRELVSYLPSLFPEISPPEKPTRENTPLVPHEAEGLRLKPPGGDWSSKEDTVGADSEVIRQKHREAEVFEVEGTQRTDSSSIGLSDVPVRIRRPIVRPLWIGLGLGSALLILLAAWAGVRYAPILRERVFGPKTDRSMLEKIAKKNAFLKGRQEAAKKPEPVPAKPVAPAAPLAPAPPVPPKSKTLPPPPPQIPVSAGLSSIAVDSSPQGARIFLNDIDTGRVTPYVFDELKPGTKKIGLTLDRHRFWEGDVSVAAGQKAQVKPTLALNVGSLEINSLPPGAEATVNGKPVGRTPLALPDLSPDSLHEIVLTLDGYEIWRGSAKIFGGKSEVLNVPLKKKLPDEPLPE